MENKILEFSLPFASIEETIFRSVSSYLLGQFFIHKKGGKPDIELNGLKETYGNIEKINDAMARRIRSADRRDANVNAVVILDVFAKFIPISIGNCLKNVSHLY